MKRFGIWAALSVICGLLVTMLVWRTWDWDASTPPYPQETVGVHVGDSAPAQPSTSPVDTRGAGEREEEPQPRDIPEPAEEERAAEDTGERPAEDPDMTRFGGAHQDTYRADDERGAIEDGADDVPTFYVPSRNQTAAGDPWGTGRSAMTMPEEVPHAGDEWDEDDNGGDERKTDDYAGTDAKWLRPTEPREGTAYAGEEAVVFHVYDDFEKENEWAVESAADHAELSLADGNASEGARALCVKFKACGKGQFEIRREVDLNLSGARHLSVDILNEADPMQVKLAVRTYPGMKLFESPAQPLEKGWNKNLQFGLTSKDISSKGDSVYSSDWSYYNDMVTRLSFVFGEEDNQEGTVYVDNMRFDRRVAELDTKKEPTLRKITASRAVLERFEALELSVDLEADYQDFFDRDEIDVIANFFSPSGEKLAVHGFLHDIVEDGVEPKPIWRIRFTPTEVGRWRYDITVKAGYSEKTSGIYEFLCQHKEQKPGFVRVSEADPRYFELDSGDFFYPIGQNVCWASDYDYYLKKVHDYGGNWVRVWLCPWDLQLEEPKEPGKYDLQVAGRIDKLLQSAEKLGVHVQLALMYHGMLDDSWSKSPYNVSNGGPCSSASEFFTDSRARAQFKQLLDYVVARWGHSTAVFAWELWNEVDLAVYGRKQEITDWHKEMGQYLKEIDVNRHLVTTSTSRSSDGEPLFSLEEIDFIPDHFYGHGIADTTLEQWCWQAKYGKPYFVSEFASGHEPKDVQEDRQGIHLHAGLWLSFMTPTAGNAMPWWWDIHVDKHDLYHQWRALTKFSAGEDRRGRNFEIVVADVETSKTTTASIRGLLSPSVAYLWIFDEEPILKPGLAGRPLLAAGAKLELEGLLGGQFRVEVWDTHECKILQESTVTTEDGRITVTLPESDKDLAVKLKKVGAGRPKVRFVPPRK